MKKEYKEPEFKVVQSLSEYCVGLTLGLQESRSGYTQIETEDPFGDK